MSEPRVINLDRPKGDSVQGLRVRPLVRVENLAKFFPMRAGFWSRLTFLRAVDGVTLHVRRAETLGLVGESGCGKSMLARAMLRLVEPTYGRIVYDGKEVVTMKPAQLRALRRKAQIVFQDPSISLNPKMTVRETVGEALRMHKLVRADADEQTKVGELVDRVGLRREAVRRYPHELSTGQKQRVALARALAVGPELIICDEAVSALDFSAKAQIANLIQDLQEDLGVAFLFISHDLRMVHHLSHRVAVMYLGKIVETAKVDELFEKRHHPYTRALLSVLEGDAPSPLDPPSGCAFHPRCPRARKGKCDKETPELAELVAGTNHRVACFFPET